ncbi:MAG: DUF1727 domain-containing protein, partial [Ktedonobacteraceae bacterium]
LNDNIADGRDVSWIWDVDFERAVGQTVTLVAAGNRALDLGLRLKYAGVPQREMIIIPPAPLRAMKRDLALNKHNKRAIKNSNKSDAVVTETIKGMSSTQRPDRFGITQALDAAVQLTPVGETLFVVPTYTGLLEIHRELERRGLTPHYWEGRDS